MTNPLETPKDSPEKDNLKEGLEKLQDSLIPSVRIEGDIPGGWNSRVTKLGGRYSKEFQIQIVTDGGKGIWGWNIDETKVPDDGSSVTISSNQTFSQEYFTDEEKEFANKNFSFSIARKGTEYVVIIKATDEKVVGDKKIVKDVDTKTEKTIVVDPPEKIIIPEFPVITTLGSPKDDLDGYTFHVGEVGDDILITNDSTGGQVVISALSINDKTQWEYNTLEKQFVYKQSLSLNKVPLSILLSEEKGEGVLSFTQRTIVWPEETTVKKEEEFEDEEEFEEESTKKLPIAELIETNKDLGNMTIETKNGKKITVSKLLQGVDATKVSRDETKIITLDDGDSVVLGRGSDEVKLMQHKALYDLGRLPASSKERARAIDGKRGGGTETFVLEYQKKKKNKEEEKEVEETKEVTSSWPPISTFIMSDDGSSWTFKTTDPKTFFENDNGEVNVAYNTSGGALDATFKFVAGKDDSQLPILQINGRYIISNTIVVDGKKYSMKLRNMGGAVYGSITFKGLVGGGTGVVDVDNKDSNEDKEVLEDKGIYWFTSYIEGDNDKMPSIKQGTKTTRIRGYYKDDIDYVGTETLNKDFAEARDKLFVSHKENDDKNTFSVLSNRWVKGRWIADHLFDVNLDDLKDTTKFTKTGKLQREGEVIGDNDDELWKIRVSILKDKYTSGEMGTVLKIDVVDIPPTMELTEEDEVLEHNGVVWLDDAKDQKFGDLPTLGKGASKKQVWGYENEGIEYQGTKAVSADQKKYIQDMRIDYDDVIGPSASNPSTFGLFGNRQWGMGFTKICDIDLSDSKKFSKISDGWLYTTTDKNNEQIILKITTREEKLNKLLSGPVMMIDVIEVGDNFAAGIDIAKQFGIDVDDFPGISKELKDAFKKITNLEGLKKWLKKVWEYLEDIGMEYLDKIEELEGETGIDFGGEIPTHLDPVVYPYGCNKKYVSQLVIDDGSGANDIALEHKGMILNTSISTLTYPKPASNPYVSSFSPTFKIKGTKITGPWVYQMTVTEVKDSSGNKKKVLRISVLPPQAYRDMIDGDIDIDDSIEDGYEKLKGQLHYPTDTKYGLSGKWHEMRGKGTKKRPHEGIDIDTPNDKKVNIVAAYPGKVIEIHKFSDKESTYGSYIIIQHEVDGKKFRTMYAHISEDDLKVAIGDKVKAGDIITKSEIDVKKMTKKSVWNNPDSGFGPHLHFEVRVKDPSYKPGKFHAGWRDVDPEPFLDKKNNTQTDIVPPVVVNKPKFGNAIKRGKTDIVDGNNVVDCIISMDPDVMALSKISGYTVKYKKADGTFETVNLGSISLPNTSNRHPKNGDGSVKSRYQWVIPKVLDETSSKITIQGPGVSKVYDVNF